MLNVLKTEREINRYLKIMSCIFNFFLEPEPFKIEPIPRGATGSSVSDPYSLNPDPAKNMNPDPVPEDPWIRIQANS